MRLSGYRTAAAMVAVAFILATGTARAQAPRARVEGVTNFGRVTETYFRGGKVSPLGVENLYKMGVRTIVDLRDEASPGEPEACERLGIAYHKVPMSGHATPDEATVAKVLEIVKKSGAPVYVHCSAGKHRAGTMAALYRMRVQGWTAEAAWAEQQSYGFGVPSEHPELFAYAYGAKSEALAASEPVPHTVAVADSAQSTEVLSTSASYIPVADVVERARKQGGTGDVLQIDLEYDVARSMVTWDVTFSSGFEYEFDAVSGKHLGTNEKSPAKLARMQALSVDGESLKGFQEVMRAAESKASGQVMEMELKHMKGQAKVVYEVQFADGRTIYFDATTGTPIERM
jgi:tyrosine-protein phosphatase SIW14